MYRITLRRLKCTDTTEHGHTIYCNAPDAVLNVPTSAQNARMASRLTVECPFQSQFAPSLIRRPRGDAARARLEARWAAQTSVSCSWPSNWHHHHCAHMPPHHMQLSPVVLAASALTLNGVVRKCATHVRASLCRTRSNPKARVRKPRRHGKRGTFREVH